MMVPFPQTTGLEKMAELAYGGLVGGRLVSEVDSDEVPHGFHVVKGFFRPPDH